MLQQDSWNFTFSNISIVLLAAFAASEGHAHPRVVELPKTDEGNTCDFHFTFIYNERISFLPITRSWIQCNGR